MNKTCLSIVVGICVTVALPALLLRAADDSKKLKPLPRLVLRNPRLAERYLNTRDVEEVLEFERVEPVCRYLLKQSGVGPEFRLEALQKLIEIRQSDYVREFIEALKSVDYKKSPDVIRDLATLLPKAPPDAFRKHRAELEAIAKELNSDELWQAILVTTIKTDGQVEPTWNRLKESPQELSYLLKGIDLLDEPQLKSQLFPLVLDLLRSDSSDDLRQHAISAIVKLPGDRKAVFSQLVDFVQRGIDVPQSLAALAKLPADSWDAERLPKLVEHGIAYIESLSISDRVKPENKQIIRMLHQLAERLPQDQRENYTKTISRLTVQEFVVATVPEKMAYDTTVLVMEAGRPVRITFRNDDIMPHNLVIGTEPAARVELGLMADEMQADKNALAKGYVPDSPLVMHASKLIQPGVVDVLEFIAPPAGIYPYVCTFPGHWSKMYGAIKVVSDADELKLVRSQSLSADDLLGIRTVEWTFEELAKDIQSVNSGRSFKNGERWFKQASCYSCHRMKGTGGLIGPDLTDIRMKYKSPAELLQHILDPSKSIDDKYASVTVFDLDGKVHRGVVIKRTDEELVLQENPLQSCAPVVIRIEDIDEEVKSPLSPMPVKLLNAIVDKNEVYDLLAYLLAGGNASDPRFAK